MLAVESQTRCSAEPWILSEARAGSYALRDVLSEHVVSLLGSSLCHGLCHISVLRGKVVEATRNVLNVCHAAVGIPHGLPHQLRVLREAHCLSEKLRIIHNMRQLRVVLHQLLHVGVVRNHTPQEL